MALQSFQQGPRRRGVRLTDFDPGLLDRCASPSPTCPAAVALALALRIWGHLHGLVSLQIYGHLRTQTTSPEKLFQDACVGPPRRHADDPRPL